MNRVLITGVNGFIGSNLAERLLNDGYDVYGLMKFVVGRDLSAVEPLKKMKIISADICDYNAINRVLKDINPDYVMHLAALSPVRLSFELPFEFQQTNYIGSLNIAHSMLQLPDFQSRRLIVASSGEVYGIQTKNEPFSEDLPLLPSSPYSVSKAGMDMYIRMMIKSYGLNATIMRCTNTYGRRFVKGFIIEYILNQIKKKETIYIGAPDSIRDYMYVDDHVNAYVKAMDEKAKGEVFNTGTGIGISNSLLSHMLCEKMDYDESNVVYGSYPPDYPVRPIKSDQPYLVLNAEKIRRILGWEAKVSLSEGLDRIIGEI